MGKNLGSAVGEDQRQMFFSKQVKAAPSPTQASSAEKSESNVRQLLKRSASCVGRGKNPSLVCREDA